MADRIKGITIEIGGDTTGLSKALSGTNKEIGNTQKQLKDVERLLKLDPKNTELLQQKQKLLSQEVGETKTKLDALKDAEKQVQQQFEEGKVSQEQYDALKREIAATEQQLKDLKTQADNASTALSRIGQAGETMKNIGDKITGVGKKLLPVTGAVAAVGTASVAAMDAVDEGLDIVVKKTGATGDSAKELQKVYNDVATAIPADFSDIGSAVGEINTRLGFTGDKLTEASKRFLEFAKVNDVDVNTSVQLVTRAMGDAGIQAEDYADVLDMLTVAGQQSGISIDTLATNLAKYGAPMRALGIDTKDAIALFAGWEKAGVNTEIAFSGMKKAISNWGKEGKDAGAEFSKVMKEIEDAPDIASATSIAIDTFGAKAGPDLADAIQGGRFEVEEYVKALENAGGTVEDTYGGIIDEVDDTQLAMQTAQVALHDIGEAIMKTIGPILLELAKKLQGVGDWFSNLDDKGKNTVLMIAGIVAGIGPFLIILGKVAGGIGAIMTVVSKLSGAISFVTGTIIPALGSAISFLAANPIVLIIGAVVGLVALIATKGDEIQAILQKVDDFLQNIFVTDWTEIFGPGLGDGLNAFFANVKNIWDSVKQIFDGIIDFIAGVFSGDWERAWKGVQEIFGGIFDGLIAIVKAPINGIIGILNGAIGGINMLIRGLNKIKIDVPDWVPFGWGGKTFGFNIGEIGKIPYMAKGGILSQGSAVVGEAGPELLTMMGNRAMVQPLTGQSNNTTNVGGVNVFVYGAPGQDVNELADIIADKIDAAVQRKGAVFA
ncbi:phage tail tape measure protein [Qiania dongpingensis]|uniref:Phage tail tape measure protein n=1 Tax=Qiania dongpingensis TaxID=2763669 RepID=A0A7G9G6Y5_9FIRM|nr:phage tail tape measure protein [Qiania dongpingensis]QNM06567.1 phage tail tape measure protein [Qiania dongpingensis]